MSSKHITLNRVKRIRTVQDALKLILDGRNFSRQDIFGKVEVKDLGWQKNVLAQLVKLRYIEKIDDKQWKLVSGSTLANSLDDLSISQFIWPSSNPAVQEQISFEETASVDTEAIKAVQSEEAPSSDDIAQTTLKILAANIQNTVYIRERVDFLLKRIEELTSQNKELDKKLELLITKLAPLWK